MRILTRGVSFNLDDPMQADLHAHARTHVNFSGYVKRLIQRDKDTVEQKTKAASHVTLVLKDTQR